MRQARTCGREKSTVPTLVSILFLLVLFPSINFIPVTLPPPVFHLLSLTVCPPLPHTTSHPHVIFSLSLENSFLSTLFHRETRAVKTCWAKLDSHTGLSQGVALWVCVHVIIHDSHLWICVLFINYVPLCAYIGVCVENRINYESEDKHWDRRIICIQVATGFSTRPHWHCE